MMYFLKDTPPAQDQVALDQVSQVELEVLNENVTNLLTNTSNLQKNEKIQL